MKKQINNMTDNLMNKDVSVEINRMHVNPLCVTPHLVIIMHNTGGRRFLMKMKTNDEHKIQRK